MSDAGNGATVAPAQRRPGRAELLAMVRREEERLTVAALALAMVVAAVAIYRKGLGLTFFFDEWDWVLDRRDWSLDAFLDPHNEHIAVVPAAIFKVLFVTVGIDEYWPYRVVLLAAHLVCVALVFLLARRRVPSILALAPALSILGLGSAWEDLLWPFQIGFVLSIAAGLGMLLALETRREVVAAILLAVSLASSSVGIPFAAAAVVEIALTPGRWRRLWIVVGAPLVLYGLWYVVYGTRGVLQGTDKGTVDLVTSNLPLTPNFVGEMAAAAFAGLIGLSQEWGRLLAMLAITGLVWRILRGAPISPRLAALLVALSTSWILTGLFRAHLGIPAAPRYVYLGAVIVVLAALELARGARVTPRLLAVLAVFLAIASVANFNVLGNGSRSLQDTSAYVSAELGAVEIVGRKATDPSLHPDPMRMPNVRVGLYLDAVADLGSPADTPAEIERHAEQYRQAADKVMVELLDLDLEPAAGSAASGPRPTVDKARGGQVVGFGQSCVAFRPDSEGALIEIAVPVGGLSARTSPSSSAQLALRTFAAEPAAGVGTVSPGTSAAVEIPATNPPRVWFARFTASAVTPDDVITACGLRGGD